MQTIKTKVKPTITQESTKKYSLAVLLAQKPFTERTKIMEKLKKKGVGIYTISRIKNVQKGEKYEPLIGTMQIIADVLNVSIDNLITQD